MNNNLRNALVITALLASTVSTKAQVESVGKVIDYTTHEYVKDGVEIYQLNLDGKSTIKYTLQEGTNTNTSYTCYVELRKGTTTNYEVIESHHYGFVRDRRKNVKIYKLTNATYGNNKTYFKYNSNEVLDCDTISGEFHVEDGTSDYYLYFPFLMTESAYTGYSQGVLGSWHGQNGIEFDDANGINKYSYCNMHRLTATVPRYDIYDDKPLWKADGEDTESTTDIKSNRMNAMSHDSRSIGVTVHRNLVKGSWTTLSLPFDVSVADLKTDDALGSDARISEFSDVHLDIERVNFKTISNSTATLKAGKPYLVYYNGENKSSFFVPNVKFDYTSTTAVNELASRKSDNVSHGYTYNAVLQPTEQGSETEQLDGGCMVYVATPVDGVQHLKKLKQGGSIKGFRAYLHYPATAIQSAAKGTGYICIDNMLDGEATALPSVSVDGMPVSNAIYNLNGQYVGTDASQLPRGIYVRNGKKFYR